MKTMLSQLRLLDRSGNPMYGFHHLGMHDVENICRCALHLLEEGHQNSVNGAGFRRWIQPIRMPVRYLKPKPEPKAEPKPEPVQSSLTSTEKEFLKAAGKVREILAIEEKVSTGVQVDKKQVEKVDKKATFLQELAKLVQEVPAESNVQEKCRDVLETCLAPSLTADESLTDDTLRKRRGRRGGRSHDARKRAATLR